MKRSAKLASFAILAAASLAVAQTQPSTDAAALLAKTKPSLVVAQFTYDGEMGRREFSAMGVVVREDGLTIVPADFMPRQFADSQVTDFKLVIPGDEEKEVECDWLGRDERYNVLFFLPKQKQTFIPIKFEAAKLQVGQPIRSVGLLPKSAGYQQYTYGSQIAAVLRGPVPQVLVDGTGMTVAGSVVFDDAGKAVGLVNAQNDRRLVLGREVLPMNDRPLSLDEPQNPNATIENPTRTFIPASDFIAGLENAPTKDHPPRFPFIGVTQLTGLSKDLAEYYNLKGKVAVQVGDVIPKFSAARAGLKKGDIIVSVDGQPLERGDTPEEAPLIFTRHLARLEIGQKVMLGIVTGPDTPPKPVEVTLDERPAPASKSKRFYAEDLGFTTRNSAFEDTYSRKLAADAKGVVIAFVRPQSAAQTATLQNGDFVRQINQTPVTDVDQFKEQYDTFRKDKPKEAVVLEVLRGGNTQIIRIEPPRE
jgi:membrane-associated protease RseP (regulator of RpoE activity)